MGEGRERSNCMGGQAVLVARLHATADPCTASFADVHTVSMLNCRHHRLPVCPIAEVQAVNSLCALQAA